MKYLLLTISFLFLSLLIQAQGLGQDGGQGVGLSEACLRTLGAPVELYKGLEDEEYSLDPHYDESGRIKYYGLADIIRLNYSYNDEGQIASKILYVRNDVDDIWKKYKETTYIYSENRLKEELVSVWWLNELLLSISSEVKEPNYRIHTLHRFGNSEKTDTMKVKMTSIDIDTLEMTAIKYLNEKMLCDSLILYNEPLIAYQKWVMTYDDSNRCTKRSLYFHRNISPFDIPEIFFIDPEAYTSQRENMEPHTVWWYAYEIKTVYDTNKTVYTHIAINNKKTYELILGYDTCKQLTEQTFTYCDRLLTKGTFSYDKQGRTIVNKEIQSGNLTYFSNLGVFKYSLQYDTEGQQIATYHRYDNDDKKYNKWRESFTRSTPSGLVTSFRKNNYYKEGGLSSTEKGENVYNDKGMLTRLICHFWDDDDTYKWYETIDYVFDYDAHGNKILSEYYQKIDADSPREGRSKNVYRYNAMRQIIYEEYFKFKNGAWTNNTKKYFTFSPTGKSTSYTEYGWHDDMWSGVKRDSTVYNTDDRPKMQIDYRWHRNEKDWKLWDLTEYEYTSHDSINTEIKRFYHYRYNEMTPSHFTAKASGPNYSSISKGVWDDDASNWAERSKQVYYIDENGYQISEEYEWDEERNELISLEMKKKKSRK